MGEIFVKEEKGIVPLIRELLHPELTGAELRLQEKVCAFVNQIEEELPYTIIPAGELIENVDDEVYDIDGLPLHRDYYSRECIGPL